jgi:AbiU2
MTYRTPEDAQKQYVEKMGEPLGRQFSALWQEVASLHLNWKEFVELFASKSTRVDILNEAAPHFFRLAQDALLESTLLHISRLTDVSKTFKRDDKANLTIRNLPSLIDRQAIKIAVEKLVDTAVQEAQFCKDWRDRRIAHRDLALALDKSATPLAIASKRHVDDALEVIAEVLNTVEADYMDSVTAFDFAAARRGGVALLYILNDGIVARRKRKERLQRGDLSEGDHLKEI